MRWLNRLKRHLPISRKKVEELISDAKQSTVDTAKAHLNVVISELNIIKEDVKERTIKDIKANRDRGHRQAANTRDLNNGVALIVEMDKKLDRLKNRVDHFDKSELDRIINRGISDIQERLVRCVNIQEDIKDKWLLISRLT